MIDFDSEFCDFAPTKRDGYIEIKLPILLDKLGQRRLVVRVVPLEGGDYILTDEGTLFAELGNRGAEYYHTHFLENAPPPHYGMKLEGEVFCKRYAFNYNPTVALDDFIRFFLALEEHIDKYELLED